MKSPLIGKMLNTLSRLFTLAKELFGKQNSSKSCNILFASAILLYFQLGMDIWGKGRVLKRGKIR